MRSARRQLRRSRRAASIACLVLIAWLLCAPLALAIPSVDRPTAWGSQTFTGDSPGVSGTYEPVYPSLPTDAQIAAAVERVKQTSMVANGWEDGVKFGMLQPSFEYKFEVVDVKPYKVHAVDPSKPHFGVDDTGNGVVALVTLRYYTGDGKTRDATSLYVLEWVPSENLFAFVSDSYLNEKKMFGEDAGQWYYPKDLNELYAHGYAADWVDAAGAAPPVEGGGGPWRTVGAGIAAVAAAATAIAGASMTARGGKSKLDPQATVGYVLQVSTRRLQVATRSQSPFEATAWQVKANGSFSAAEDVAITLQPPAGVSAVPTSGGSDLKANVWQTAPLSGEAQLTVVAQGAKGGTQAAIALVPESASRLEVTVEPEGRGALKPDGRDALTLVAKVVLAPSLASDPAFDAEKVRASIAFSHPAASEWLNVGGEADVPGGRSAIVSASNPQPGSYAEPPASATVTVTATVGAEQLSQPYTITLERPPALDAKPDALRFSAGSKETADVLAIVEPSNGAEWTITAELAKGDREVVRCEPARESAASATVRITEAADPDSAIDAPTEQVTVRLLANADGYDQLERWVRVSIVREGVYVDATGRDADGTFHIAADGSGQPTDIDVRVFVRDPATGAIGFDANLSQSLTVEARHDGNGPGPLGYAEVVHEAAGIRPSNSPSAIHRFHTSKVLPTEGKPVTARYEFRVEGKTEPGFSAIVPVSLIGVNMAPYSPAWEVEYERCKQIIERYVPTEDQGRMLKMLAERGHTMGAEGLFALRKKIWSFAETRMQQEINAQLDKAWENQQIEEFLDWVSWCGDIAIGVASGSLVGTSASIAVGALKPVLVSAVTAWVNGSSIEVWATEQVYIVLGAVEGAATDIDFLKKLTGGKAALAWAAYLSYYFVKELINDPNRSVTEAMKNVARMVRDEALIAFLRGHAGTSIHGKPKADGTAAETPAGPRPHGDGAEPPKPAKPPVPEGVAPPTRPGKAGPGAEPGAPKPHAPEGAEPPTQPHGDAEPDAPRPPADEPAPKPHGDEPNAEPGSPKPDAGEKPGAEPKPPAEKPPADAPPAEKPPAEPKPDGADKPPADKEPVGPPVEVPPPGQPMTGRQAAALVRKNMTSEGGVNKVDRATVERIMRDPDAAREMRRSDPEAYKAYDATRQEMRAEHDKRLADYASALPGLTDKNVKVETVGTEGGIDRDYRVLVEVPDPREPGKSMWLEVPRERWVDQSNRIFAEQTGGPKDVEGARKWAADHQQLGTDQYHGEASIDMSDQAWRINPETGQREQIRVPSRLSEVEAGNGTLLDPEGLGKTYQTKVAESSAAGKLDGYTQAKKACDTLEAVRDGYTQQDYKVGELDPRLKESMGIVRQVAEGKLTPAQGDSLLKGGGYGDLNTVMEKMSSQFAALKWAKK